MVVRQGRIAQCGERDVDVDREARGRSSPPPASRSHGRARSSRRPAHRTNRTTNGATNSISRWLPRASPISRPPMARSERRRRSAQTSARWTIRATNIRWSGLTSETVAAAQTVPTAPVARAPAIAITGRTPSRSEIRLIVDEGDRDVDRRQEVGAKRDRADRQQLGQPGHHDVRRIARRMGHAEDVRARSPSRPSRRRRSRASASGHRPGARRRRR